MTAHDPQRADRILAAIEASITEKGYPPTVRELVAAVGLKSNAAVQHHLARLEADGLISIDRHTARGIRVVAD
jgi:repressor LexA